VPTVTWVARESRHAAYREVVGITPRAAGSVGLT